MEESCSARRIGWPQSPCFVDSEVQMECAPLMVAVRGRVRYLMSDRCASSSSRVQYAGEWEDRTRKVCDRTRAQTIIRADGPRCVAARFVLPRPTGLLFRLSESSQPQTYLPFCVARSKSGSFVLSRPRPSIVQPRCHSRVPVPTVTVATAHAQCGG